MIFDTQGMEFEIVPSAKAKLLRETFIEKFVDTTSDPYRKHIEFLRQKADDLFYDGYLWDCLRLKAGKKVGKNRMAQNCVRMTI